MGKTDHFISLDEARRIARDECGINNEQLFKTSLNFLHDLRILIHFDDTPKLKDMVILDPQWLIDLFRKVITVKPYERKSDEPQYKELWKKLQNKGVLEEHIKDPYQFSSLEVLIQLNHSHKCSPFSL